MSTGCRVRSDEAGRFSGAEVTRLRRADAPVTDAVVRAHGLSKQEYQHLLAILGRTPTLVELGIVSVMWSEHCCYKSSRALLKRLPTTGSRILKGPGENAGAVDLGGNLAVVFKAESHNHPSFVMPYHGAATGVGGILRDVFTLGARPIALLDALRFGPTSDPLSRDIFFGVVDGIAGYGNCIGVPTVGGEVFFDASFARNPLVNVMAVGVAPSDRLLHARAEGPGNSVFIVGARTGRDGIHGATFASDVMVGDGGESRPQVQIGDPFLGKELMEAVLDLAETDWLIGIQDMGAAGLTCSSVEMSAHAGTGMVLDLDLVPVREAEMTPYEIMLSESQERMLVIARPGCDAHIEKLFRSRGLICQRIGEVVTGGCLQVRWHGQVVADLPVNPLTDDAPLIKHTAAPPPDFNAVASPNPLPAPMPDLTESLLALLGSENLRSRAFIFSQYDHTVRGDTLVLPGDADAAVIRLRDRDDAIAVTLGGNSRFCQRHPRSGAALTVAEAARNLACVGARPLAITDGLNYADPHRPDVYWQFSEAIEGLREACLAFDTPVTGGNVSFYNETDGVTVAPSPIVGMVGHLPHASHARRMGWQRAGDTIALLGDNRAQYSGSEYQAWLAGRPSGVGPAVDLDAERALVEFLVRSAELQLLHSAHDIAQGGLLVALAECCLTSPAQLGARIDALPSLRDGIRPDALLYSEEGARAVVSFDPAKRDEIAKLAAQFNVPFAPIGTIAPDALSVLNLVHVRVDHLRAAWRPGTGLAGLAWPAEEPQPHA